jgi:hypothetical protein
VSPIRDPIEWPFAVVALSPELRGATIEPTVEQARRRAVRLLRQVGAGHLASKYPRNRTPFVIEGRESYSACVTEPELTISLWWLRLRDKDSVWPDPTIVAALGRGNEPILPTLAPDRNLAKRWAARLIDVRNVPPERVLVLPATDRHGAGTAGQWVDTMSDVLDHYTVVEEVVRAATATTEVRTA